MSLAKSADGYSIQSLAMNGKLSLHASGSLSPLLSFINKPEGLETTFEAAYAKAAESTELSLTASIPSFGFESMHATNAKLALTSKNGAVQTLAFIGELPLDIATTALASGPWQVTDVRPLSARVSYDKQAGQLSMQMASSFAITTGAESSEVSVSGKYDVAAKSGELTGSVAGCISEVLGVPSLKACDLRAAAFISEAKLAKVTFAGSASAAKQSSTMSAECTLSEEGCAWSANGELQFDLGSTDVLAVGSSTFSLTRSAAAGLHVTAKATLLLKEGDDQNLWPAFASDMTLNSRLGTINFHGTMAECSDAFMAVA